MILERAVFPNKASTVHQRQVPMDRRAEFPHDTDRKHCEQPMIQRAVFPKASTDHSETQATDEPQASTDYLKL